MMQDDVQDRKNYMKMKDLQRRKNEKLNDLQEEERIKREELKQMALEKLQEQEDEIKKLNEVSYNMGKLAFKRMYSRGFWWFYIVMIL